MTELLSVLWAQQPAIRNNTCDVDQIQQILTHYQIHDFLYQDGFLTFLFPTSLFLTRPTQPSIPPSYSLFASLTHEQGRCSISYSLLDANGCIVKAELAYQRLALIRLGLTLNSSLQFFRIKTNPVNGEFCLCHEFLEINPTLLQGLELSLRALEKEEKVFLTILWFLEKEVEDQNTFVKQIERRLGEQDFCLQNSFTEEQAATTQQQHSEYFFAPTFKSIHPPPLLSLPLAANHRINFSHLVKQLKEVRKSNLTNLNIKEAINTKFLTHIPQAGTDSEALIMNILTGGSNFQLKMQIDHQENVALEYRKCDKASRKCYFTFLKDYVLIKNPSDCRSIIFYIAEKTNALARYLLKNQMTMSAGTRVKIALDIAKICIICAEDLKTTQLSLKITNLLIGPGLSIKIDRLSYKGRNLHKDAATTVFRIFYGNHISILERDKDPEQPQRSFSHVSSPATYIGPSAFSTLLKKPLLDILDNEFEGSQFQLLTILQSLQEYYEKEEDVRQPVDWDCVAF